MDKFELKINSKIEVVLKDGDYKCSIQDVTTDHFAITIPMRDRMYYPLDRGAIVSMLYYCGKVLYTFECEVIGRKVDRIPIIILGLPQNTRVIQRRNFVRVPVISDIEFFKIDKTFKDKSLEDLEKFKSERVKSITLDISGGGMRIMSRVVLKYGDILKVSLPLMTESFMVKSEIVRIESNEDNSNIYGLCFFDLDEKLRDKIIKCIFEIMREQRKKGD
jgi:c-di-GMP-binding flagellar brake protein YcgR